MANDKNIDCTMLDATYIGNDKNEFTENTRYRLLAVRSKGGLVKIRIDKNSSEVHIYGNDAHFNSCWIEVKRIGQSLWK